MQRLLRTHDRSQRSQGPSYKRTQKNYTQRHKRHNFTIPFGEWAEFQLRYLFGHTHIVQESLSSHEQSL